MSKCYTLEEFNLSKSKDLLVVSCDFCKKIFHKSKKNIVASTRRSKSKKDFCSSTCALTKIDKQFHTKCVHCNLDIIVNTCAVNKSKTGRFFCSQSCSATYNNTHKTKGIRRSKLEKWLEEQLTATYPNLEIHYCQKDAINSELDIYIPSLKIAFECNGIFHYEPIYGLDKLSKTQNNDNRKFQACLERNIELVIMDTSKVKYSIPRNFKPFLDIITSLIDMKLSLSETGATIP